MALGGFILSDIICFMNERVIRKFGLPDKLRPVPPGVQDGINQLNETVSRAPLGSPQAEAVLDETKLMHINRQVRDVFGPYNTLPRKERKEMQREVKKRYATLFKRVSARATQSDAYRDTFYALTSGITTLAKGLQAEQSINYNDAFDKAISHFMELIMETYGEDVVKNRLISDL